MSSITWPAALQARAFSLTLMPVQRTHASPFGGSEQVVDLLNDRWMASLELPARRRAHGGLVDGFIAGMRGMTNTVNLWHMARPVPRGSMRGTPTLSAGVSQGAASLAITTTAGATLKAGDLLGVSSLLLMVSTDCTADGAGAITVPLANRVRKALSSGAAVTWSRPTAPFRLASRAGVGYTPGVAGAVSLEFVEAITS